MFRNVTKHVWFTCGDWITSGTHVPCMGWQADLITVLKPSPELWTKKHSSPSMVLFIPWLLIRPRHNFGILFIVIPGYGFLRPRQICLLCEAIIYLDPFHVVRRDMEVTDHVLFTLPHQRIIFRMIAAQ